ncbi:glycosyltransferase [Spirochaetota bacterium]
MKRQIFIAFNAVYVNIPENNFHKYTVKLLSLLMKYDTKNNYYIFFPVEEDLQKLLGMKIPGNFNIIQTGETYFLKKRGSKVLKYRKRYEDNFPELIKKRTNIDFDIIFTPYNYFPQKRESKAEFWTVYHDMIPLLPIKFPPTRESIMSYTYFSFFETLSWAAKRSRILNNSAVFTISETQKEEICKLTLYKKDIYYMPNFVSPQYAAYAKKPGALGKRILKSRYGISKNFVLYVGGMGKRKNTSTLIKAIKGLPEAVQSKISFVLIGGKKFTDGPVISTGRVAEADLPYFFKHCLFFISVSKYEGFGVPPLEALYFKKPLILSDSATYREIFAKLPLYVNPCSVTMIQAAISTMIKDLSKYKRSINANYRRILSKYEEKKSVKDFLALLKAKAAS